MKKKQIMRNAECGVWNKRSQLRSQNIPQSAIRNPQSNRRGILLLVVLSMLTLFLLIGTAFIVSANHYRKAQKIRSRLTETSNSSIDQGNLLDEVVNQLLRDTNNQNSALRYHSLLRDMYGNDGIEIGPNANPTIRFVDRSTFSFTRDSGVIVNTNLLDVNMASIGNQFFWVAVEFQIPFVTATPPLSPLANYYNGNTLSILSGRGRGITARVVKYEYQETLAVSGIDPGAGIAVFTLMPLNANEPVVASALNVGPLGTALINGRPFNGTGVGLDPAVTATNAPKLTAIDNLLEATSPLALSPNHVFNSRDLSLEQLSNDEVEQLLNQTPVSFFLTPNQISELDSHLVNNLGFNPNTRNYHLAFLEAIREVGAPGLGGSDESYDAVDFQNMSLALMPINPVETTLPENSLAAWEARADWPGVLNDLEDNSNGLVLPSFHRPALINYWANLPAFKTNTADPVTASNLGLPANASMLRKILLRPNWHDHPRFTGSNPDFANLATDQERLTRMIYGPWDVDNDNDGIRDSIWVDFGAPVIENSDGRLVKPLAAILVLDMDGRLNLNVHGSPDIAGATPSPTPQTLAGGVLSSDLPSGQGFGSAEISLNSILDSSARQRLLLSGSDVNEQVFPIADDNAPIGGVPAANRRTFRRRFLGKLGLPIDLDDGDLTTTPNTLVFPSGNLGFDLSAQLTMQGVPANSQGLIRTTGIDQRWGNADDVLFLGAYATLPDFRGRYALGLNDLGQPIYESLFETTDISNRLDADTPYEIDLSLGAARGENNSAEDTPYSIAELERILRAYDPDADTLPSRIWEFAGAFRDNSIVTTPNLDRLNLWRTTLTTDSYDLPVPSVLVPQWMVETGPDASTTSGDEYAAVMGKPAVGANFSDILEYRIRAAQSPIWRKIDDAANPARLPAIRNEIRKLQAPELADGLRLDINRPIGNGRDDNANNVVDEPGEWDDIDTGDGIGDGDGEFDNGEEPSFWASNNPQLASFVNPATGKFRNDSMLLREASDRNNDGAVDTLDRDAYETALQIVNSANVASATNVERHSRQVVLDNLRRQVLARDLYVLAMTLIDPLPVPAGGITDPTYVKKQSERARKLAQWAINIVDFRDPDNIMTAFEYDVNPFDGWNPDGNIAIDTDIAGPDTQVGTDDDTGGVVWGAERPEVLMTESIAWHDRRSKDTGQEIVDITDGPAGDKKGTVNSGDDQDFDQRQRPRGYGFIELYCPWPENPATNADTYSLDSTTNKLGVDLARTHDDTATVRDPSNGSPVWRMMVYKKGGSDKNPDALKIENQPLDFGLRFRADRSIYFTTTDPASLPGVTWDDNADGTAFFCETANVAQPLLPGNYMVVGAGEDIGGGVYRAPFGQVVNFNEEADPTGVAERGIELDTNNDNDPTNDTVTLQTNTGAPLQDAAGFAVSANAQVAIIDQVLSSGTASQRRFSFSEPPARGYPSSASFFGNVYNPPLDVPLDDQRFPYKDPAIFVDTLKDGETRLQLPIGNTQARRTIPGFSWVYLQRLANPLLPWNPPFGEVGHDNTLAVNPYRTIDSMGVNVTVFNGLEPNERRWPDGADRMVLANLETYGNFRAIDSFSSVQRGRSNNPEDPGTNLSFQPGGLQDSARAMMPRDPDASAPVLTANLWNPEALGIVETNRAAGYWENKAGPSGNGSDTGHNLEAVPDCTLGFLNEPLRGVGPYTDADGDGEVTDDMDPASPFSWFTWNNRPFANANELMLVPAYSASQMLRSLSMRDPASTNSIYTGNVEEIDFSDTGTADKDKVIIKPDGDYGHLLNFFRSKADPGIDTMPGTLDDEGIVGLYRLLDYIQVPSRFVGTETWLNPAAFGNVSVTQVVSTDDPRYLRQPPFNRIDEYRDPGLVNLNTVVNQEVYEGLMHGDPGTGSNPPNGVHPGPAFSQVQVSRRGYGNLAQPLLQLDNATPTFFENPFRVSGAIDLVPIPEMLQFDTSTARGGTQATLLRQDELSTAMAKPPLFAAETNQRYNDANRNAYFRYQPMTRLSSMTTTRSNVYAVWVTIGFFEVTEAPDINTFATVNGLVAGNGTTQALYNKVYPEGFQLGQEAGSDTGDIRRVREFAIIDRTVPVAFEPGKNHNVDKAVRLRRRIE